MSIGVRVAGLNINHTPNPMNKTSSLDTTLREKFYSKIAEFSGPEGSAIDPYPMQRIADWWLTQFHQLMNEKREAIEGMRQNLPKRPCINAENEMFGRCFDCEKTKGFNTALDDVLSILKD